MEIASPVKPSDLFKDRWLGLPDDVDELCEPIRKKFESDQLLRSDADRASATLIPLAAGAILVALALYKIVIGLAERRPVGFLILLALVSLALLWHWVGSLARAHISERGKAYLKRLQVAYRGMRQPDPRGTDSSPQPDMASLAMVSLLGIGIHSETPDAAFASLFAKGASGGGGGCGSGGGGGGCGG
jgi:uncharacterized protein (TIGR04222 family)